MKFAHIADCHLGCWRQKEMQQANLEAFNKTIDRCILEKVDFILIAGDFFDNAIPNIDILKKATENLKKLHDNNIPCFVVPGSHDYSVSGKTMLHVLEKAGMLIDVTNPFETNDYFIAGIGGERKGIEMNKIHSFKAEPSNKNKLKILALHTTINEMEMPFQGIPLNELPRGFDYYALGHIHRKKIFTNEKFSAAYPGALFPCSFSELEEEKKGNFLIVEYDNGAIQKIREIDVKIKDVESFKINADNETPQSLNQKIIEQVTNVDIRDKIVLIRIEGILASGKISDLNIKNIENEILSKGAYSILRNTNKLITKEFEIAEKEFNMNFESISAIENNIISEMIKQKIIEEHEREKVLMLMACLDTEKTEGENNDSFEERLNEEIAKKLGLEL